MASQNQNLDESVEILDVKPENIVDSEDDNCVSEEDMVFPREKLDKTAMIRFRTYFIAERDEWYRFSEDTGEIYLESWEVRRYQHTFVKEYGVLRRVPIVIGDSIVRLNVIVVKEDVEVMDMPMFIPTGMGNAYTVGEKVFNVFRDFYKENNDDEGIDAGMRLLYHTIVDRRCAKGLTLRMFSKWSAIRIKLTLEHLEGQAPGHLWSRFTAKEACLVSQEEREKMEGCETEKLLEDIKYVLEDSSDGVNNLDIGEAEPVKIKLTTSGERDVSGSPKLASPPLIRNDVDEHKAEGNNNKKRRRRRNKRKNKQEKGEKEAWWRQGTDMSPITLSKAQENWLVKLLVQGVTPGASEEEIVFNQENVVDGRGGFRSRHQENDVKEEVVDPSEYGTGPGGWVLSREDKEDIMSLKSMEGQREMSASSSFGAGASSFASPRGELSYMGSFGGQGEWSVNTMSTGSSHSGPTRKRVRLSVSSEMPPLEDSPFLAKVGDTPRIVTISSSSSSGGSGIVRRLSLGDMISGKSFVFPDDGIVCSKTIEVFTEKGGKSG